MYNINFNNINIDDLKKCFETGLSKERELFDESLEREPKATVILVKMVNEFHQLLGDICAGKFGKIYPPSLHRIKNIMQSLHFAPLLPMRGHIRAGYSEMRFLIEEICFFVYFLNDKNCKAFEEEVEKRVKEKGLDMRNTNDSLIFKIWHEVNKSQKDLVYKYLKEIDPTINHHLKEIKELINSFFMHSNAIGTHGDKGVNLSGVMGGFDSKWLRDKNLRRSMVYMASIMLSSYSAICAGLEKRPNASIYEYREKVGSVKKLLRELVNPPGSENV